MQQNIQKQNNQLSNHHPKSSHHSGRHKNQQVFHSFSQQSSGEETMNKQQSKQKEIQRKYKNKSIKINSMSNLMKEKNYKAQPLQFASKPTQVIKYKQLLSIYNQNSNIISSLSKQLQKLSSQISLMNFLSYSSQLCVSNNIFPHNSTFQQQQFITQIIDLDEHSQYVQQIKKKYQSSVQQMNKLKKSYDELNQEQIENYMLKDQDIKLLLNQYVKKNKYVISIKCYESIGIVMLTKEKYINMLQSNQINQQNQYKYTIRIIKFHQIIPSLLIIDQKSLLKTNNTNQKDQKIYNKLSFLQINQTNNHQQLAQISYDVLNQVYLVRNKNNMITIYNNMNNLQSGVNLLKQSQNMTNKQIKIDNNVKVILMQTQKQNLFIGTSDGVLRIYQAQYQQKQQIVSQQNSSKSIQIKKIKKFSHYKLIKIIGCFSYTNQINIKQITHYSFIGQKNDQLHFIADNNKLFKVNLNFFKSQFIKQININNDQHILKITSKFIQTNDNKVYVDFDIGQLNFNKLINNNNKLDSMNVKIQGKYNNINHFYNLKQIHQKLIQLDQKMSSPQLRQDQIHLIGLISVLEYQKRCLLFIFYQGKGNFKGYYLDLNPETIIWK